MSSGIFRFFSLIACNAPKVISLLHIKIAVISLFFSRIFFVFSYPLSKWKFPSYIFSSDIFLFFSNIAFLYPSNLFNPFVVEKGPVIIAIFSCPELINAFVAK